MTYAVAKLITDLAAHADIVPEWTPTIYPNSVSGIACTVVHVEVSGQSDDGWYVARVGYKDHVPHSKHARTPADALTAALVCWAADPDVDDVPPAIHALPNVRELRQTATRARNLRRGGGSPLRSYADLALSGRPHPLLRLAQDGAQPGAAPDERRLGLVARVLVELTNAALYGHGSDEYLEGKTLDLRHAVDELAAEMDEESPLSAEAASEITHGQCVEVPGTTALARLLTHYPSNAAWHADVDELYAWSQA